MEYFFNILIGEISVVFDANSTWGEIVKGDQGKNGTLINLLKTIRWFHRTHLIFPFYSRLTQANFIKNKKHDYFRQTLLLNKFNLSIVGARKPVKLWVK